MLKRELVGSVTNPIRAVIKSKKTWPSQWANIDRNRFFVVFIVIKKKKLAVDSVAGATALM